MNIITVTLNPAVDITYTLDRFDLGDINRVSTVLREPGGKGLNVAKVLQYLGAKPVCMGFIGGAIGEQLASLMKQRQLENHMTRISGESRLCLNILTNSHHTELLEQGPTITKEEAAAFLAHLTQEVEQLRASYLTLSGSLPKGLDSDFYVQIINVAKQQKVKVAVDSSSAALAMAIKACPKVIKVNAQEFSSALGLASDDESVILAAMRQLEQINIILITLGKQGALAKWQEHFYRINHPPLKQLINATGSGDSVLAGLVYALDQRKSAEESLKFAIACGMENTQHLAAGCIQMDRVNALCKQITLVKIS